MAENPLAEFGGTIRIWLALNCFRVMSTRMDSSQIGGGFKWVTKLLPKTWSGNY